MNIVFIGKRHYTNRDAFKERYGRIYQLPWHWARQGVPTRLWLIDYHGRSRERGRDGALDVYSTPIRGFGWIARAISLALSRWSRSAPTHIVSSGDVNIGLLGWILARLSGAHFVFDVYDKYDEFKAYVRPFGWDPFGFLLRRADTCWFASRRLLARLGSEARGDALVMNGIDTDRFRLVDMQSARQRLGLPVEGRLVGYFGSMESDRGVTDLIEAVSRLQVKGSSVGLVLAGRKHPDTPVPTRSWLYDLGNVPFDDMPFAYAAMNVFSIPYQRSAFMDAGASNKIAEALASGRPIAATRTPNLTDNFPAATHDLKARLAAPGAPDDLARVIKLQLHDPVITPLPEEFDLAKIASAALSSLRSTEGSAAAPKAGDA